MPALIAAAIAWDKTPCSHSSAAPCSPPRCSVYVFYQPGEVEAGEEKTRQCYLLERKEATYENLRDLNFEYKAGKLSEQDYAVQRAALEDEAAAILAEMESIEKARSVVRHGTRRAGVRTDGGRA